MSKVINSDRKVKKPIIKYIYIVTFLTILSGCSSDKTQGQFLAGCIDGGLDKSTCSCIYDELLDKYTKEDIENMGKSQQVPRDLMETVKTCI